MTISKFSSVTKPKPKKHSVFEEKKEKDPKEHPKIARATEIIETLKGYSSVSSMAELHRTNFKVWPTKPRLSPAEISKPFPSLDALTVSKEPVQLEDRLAGKVSLVCVSFRKAGSEMGDSWTEFFQPQFEGQPDVQTVKVVMYDSAFHR